MEYYGDCLSNNEKLFYLRMLDAFKNRKTSVKAKYITDLESFSKCISAVQYDYPGLFFVDFSHYRYIPYDDGWEYEPKYLYDNEEAERKQKQIMELIEKLKWQMQKRGLKSIYQKCGYIHLYLIRNCTYDYAALEDESRDKAYTIEGPLIDKTGVCQGIALAFRLICMECGIDAITVRGISLQPHTSTYGRHAWNIVRAGESAAQLDITWDMCMTSKDWPVRYDYFFLPDIEMMRDHQYVGYPICRKMRMSYFERSDSQFKELNELDDFIKKKLCKEKNEVEVGKYFFQFKMINRKETEDVIENYICALIRKLTNRGYSYSMSINSAQSVFSYKLEIK